MATQIYSYTGSAVSTNGYTARNTAMRDLFTDLITNVPTGWALISSSIPAVSTTAHQVFYAIFSYGDIRIKLYTSSSSSASTYLLADIQNLSGTTMISSSSLGVSFALLQTQSSGGNYTYFSDIKLTRYSVAFAYDITHVTGAYSANSGVFGIIYLTNKSSIATDYVIISNFYTAIGYVWSANAITLSLYGNANAVKDTNGQYLMIDSHAYTTDSPCTYYGQLSNCKVICVTNKVLTGYGSLYSIGAKTYLQLLYVGDVLLDVTNG